MKFGVKYLILGIGLILLSCVFFVTAQEVLTPVEKEYVESLVEAKGIEVFGNITRINQANLPKELDIVNIEENQVGIYEVEQGLGLDNLFVISYVSEELKSPSIKISPSDRYFTFYDKNEVIDLVGEYVMLDSGSITGLSSTIETSGSGIVKIYIYKNDEKLNFFNEISTQSNVLIDFDLQSEGIINFKTGDIISIYIEEEGGANLDEISSVLKVTI